MKVDRITVQDGMYTREGWNLDSEGVRSPEYQASREEQRRRFGSLDGYLKECDRAIEETRAAINAELIDLGARVPPAVSIITSDDLSPKARRRVDTLRRQQNDLRGFEIDLRRVRELRAQGDLDGTARAAIDLGISAHKALWARPLEPDALSGKKTRAGGAAGHEKTHGTAEQKAERWDRLQRILEEVRRDSPGIGKVEARKEAARRAGVSQRTIYDRTTWK